MPRIVDAVPGTRFLVAGSGTHEPELRRQATELGLDDHGTFLGWIGDDVLHSLYTIADVCVVPSIYEPFGLVALEAMASGCPCIVADTGGLREVVPHGEAGLRFRARDARALGEMVERLLTDRELRDRLVAEGSDHILGFDWADVARSTAAVYEGSFATAPAPDGQRAAFSPAAGCSRRPGRGPPGPASAARSGRRACAAASPARRRPRRSRECPWSDRVRADHRVVADRTPRSTQAP